MEIIQIGQRQSRVAEGHDSSSSGKSKGHRLIRELLWLLLLLLLLRLRLRLRLRLS